MFVMSHWVMIWDLLWSCDAIFFAFWEFKTVPYPDAFMSRNQDEKNMDS